jgi:hypothetical protein
MDLAGNAHLGAIKAPRSLPAFLPMCSGPSHEIQKVEAMKPRGTW